MESINNFIGYGKISDHENQIHPQISRTRYCKTLIISISVVSVFAVVVLAAGVLSRPSNRSPDSLESLKTVCAVTRYPDLCFGDLASAFNGSDMERIRRLDPEDVFTLSLRASAKEISNLTVTFRAINDLPEDAAVGDCVNLFTDALSQLNESISATETKKKSGDQLTEEIIGDMKTWISAAMTDVETCSDGMEEMGSTVGDELKKQMEKAKEMMSNSLAIISQVRKLQEKFH